MAENWIALGYNIPINPSRNRVYVWRKLKEFGAEYFKQGVAILPDSEKSRAQFSSLGERIRQMGGEVTLVELRFLDPADEAEMVERFRRQTLSEYQKVLEEGRKLVSGLQNRPRGGLSEDESSQLRRTIRQLDKVRSRDHFMSGFTDDLERGFEQMVDTLRDTASDFSQQLKHALGKD